MVDALGPRAMQVYQSLRHRIVGGDLEPGARLPGQTELAATFGVAVMTVRQAWARLESEGLISRRQGSGTFVAERRTPSVLVVEDDARVRLALSALIIRAGYRVEEAATPKEALLMLERS